MADVSPDFYLPSVFSLDSANVQAVESSATNPKVRLDAAGITITNAAGTNQIEINPDGINLQAPEVATVTSEAADTHRIRWTKAADGALVAESYGYVDPSPSGGGPPKQNTYIAGALDETGANVSFTEILAYRGVGPLRQNANPDAAAIALEAGPVNRIRAIVDSTALSGGWVATILSAGGGSSFLQLYEGIGTSGGVTSPGLMLFGSAVGVPFDSGFVAFGAASAGAIAVAAAPAGHTTIGGIITAVDLTAHFNFEVHPRLPGNIVVNNWGATQSIRVKYFLLIK